MRTGDPNVRPINIGTRISRALKLRQHTGTWITRDHAVPLPGEASHSPPTVKPAT